MKEYNAAFAKAMDEDPNMGMNPKWRKKNKPIKKIKYTVEFGKPDKPKK